MGIYIGIDIGGTKMMVAAVSPNFGPGHTALGGRRKAPTPADPDAAQACLEAMIAEVAGDEEIIGIGCAIGGPIDLVAGTVSPLNMPRWRGIPMKKRMEDRYGCPFYFGVDTDAAAVAEYYLAGLDVRRFLYVTISTGVGGGFLLEGQVYRGLAGSHPEVGHQSIAFKVRHPERVHCGCGLNDCLEALVSGSGIERIYGVPARALDQEAWDEVAYNLAQGLRNMITMLAPDLIVLGGGVTTGGGRFFLDKTYAHLAEIVTLVPVPEIRISELGYDTALLGAAYLARGPRS
ncbi:MAG: ROK family protein [Bacteroidota bacterium]